jgi:succinate dehydrogenase / fumarate reductase cytochrome b subunit
MSVTGIALVLFLTFHMAMNLVAIISADGYNMNCEFLGANWYALVATAGLAALFCDSHHLRILADNAESQSAW